MNTERNAPNDIKLFSYEGLLLYDLSICVFSVALKLVFNSQLYKLPCTRPLLVVHTHTQHNLTLGIVVALAVTYRGGRTDINSF